MSKVVPLASRDAAGRAEWRLAGSAAAALALACMRPVPASAHVKWFTVTHVHDAPRALAAVLSPSFLAILAAAVVLVFLGFLLDGWVARHGPRRLASGSAHDTVEQRLVRVATGGYFIAAAAVGGMLLTPELRSQAPWVGAVQFLIALALVWRPTCVLAGLGILALYLDAMLRAGVFHLIDYLFFPCLAVYLASLSLRSGPLMRVREPLLTGGLAFSLAWTAIEKFLYPQWTIAVIRTHPSIGFGLPDAFVTVVAGFVEFTLAFYLVTGRGLLRLGGLGYAAIFLVAMPPFGKPDVFGHLIILAILAIVVLRGTTPMQNRLHLAGRGIAADSAWITFLYLLSLAAFFAMYYAMQRT